MLYSVWASVGTAGIGFFFSSNQHDFSQLPKWRKSNRFVSGGIVFFFFFFILENEKVESIGSRWKKPAIPGRRIIDPEVTGESQTSK